MKIRCNPRTIILSITLAATPLTYSAILYVDVSSSNATHPYSSWRTASTTIQEAVNAAGSGDTVLVASGTYATGSTPTPGASIASRLVITKDITVKSVAGANMTTILGEGDPGEVSGLGANAIRCVYMNSGILQGFTLENGHTTTGSGPRDDKNMNGGGAIIESSGIITNCILTSNRADYWGGGAMLLEGGKIVDSEITGNYSERGAGGAYLYNGGIIEGSTITSNTAVNNNGGGILCWNPGGLVRNCMISNNSANFGGGGAYLLNGGTIYQSRLVGNSAGFAGGAYFRNLGGEIHSSLIANNSTTDHGGGVSFYYGGKLYNSTVANNTSPVTSKGGGIWISRGAYVHNCIVWGNTGQNEFEIYDDGSQVISILNTCSGEGVVNGVNGCTTANPDFIDAAGGNYRISPASPCIDTGNDAYVSTLTDVDGQSRKLDGDADSIVHVDIGAYEYISAFSDSDTDGVSDWNEYVADTDATDAIDFFRIQNLSLSNGAVSVSFEASINRVYTVQFRENVTEGDWEDLSGLTQLSDLEGLCQLADTNTIHDTGFYTVKVELP